MMNADGDGRDGTPTSFADCVRQLRTPSEQRYDGVHWRCEAWRSEAWRALPVVQEQPASAFICVHRRFQTLSYAPPMGQMPAGQRWSVRWARISSGKCLRALVMGAGATWPRPQMEVSCIASASSAMT